MALAQMAQRYTTQYGQLYAGKNPRKVPSLNQWVGAKLQPYVR